MIFLLDANVLVDFQRSEILPALARAASVINLAVAEEVFGEVTEPTARDSTDTVGKKRQAAAALQNARLTKFEIFPGTPQAALKHALLAGLQTVRPKDHGEAASIAVAAGAPSLLVVTGDNGALLWALNELPRGGERVMRVPSFVRTLHERDALSADEVRAVAQRAASHGAIPTWWAPWLAGL